MDGDLPFREAFTRRLEIIQPSIDLFRRCAEQHPPLFTEGIREFIGLLQERKKAVWLISGGFKEMIIPAALLLNIPTENIIANRILYNNQGQYDGFDESIPTSREGGKLEVIRRLKKDHKYSKVVMIGDGSTDLEAKEECALFIGYGGVVERERIKKEADIFVTHFNELIALMK